MVVQHHSPRLVSGRWIFSFVPCFGNLWKPIYWKHLKHLKLVTPLGKKAKSIIAKDIQCFYDFAHELTPLKQIDHEMTFFMVKAQSTTEELNVFKS